MRATVMIKISGMFLLSAAILLAVLAWTYLLQNPAWMLLLATVGWN
jgi:hypothetical protein